MILSLTEILLDKWIYDYKEIRDMKIDQLYIYIYIYIYKHAINCNHATHTVQLSIRIKSAMYETEKLTNRTVVNVTQVNPLFEKAIINCGIDKG